MLFNLYSECLIEETVKNERGLNINGENVNNVRFADDAVLIAESEEDLHEMVNELNQKCNNYGRSLNAKQTKVMVIDKKEKI